PHELLRLFVDKNRDALARPAKALTDALDGQGLGSFSAACTNFNTTSRLLIQGLDVLSEIHPLVKVAVDAFKLVTLLGSQPQNNKKVLVVQMELQLSPVRFLIAYYMLSSLTNSFRIGKLGDSACASFRETSPPLMETIADAIKNCANACVVYMSDESFARTLKSKKYERLFADFVLDFRRYKDQITAITSEARGAGATQAAEALRLKLDRVFRKLDTPMEQSVLKFLDGHPLDTCIARVDVRADLVSCADRSLGTFDLTRKSNSQRGDDRLMRILKRAEREDVAQTCRDHREEFDGTLELLEEDLQTAFPSPARSIKGLLDQMEERLTAGASNKVSDSQLSDLWRQQQWKSNVKAQNFALALNYYFSEKFTEIGVPPVEPQNISHAADDRWTVSYLGVPFLRQIAEAADNDGAGYISIQEVNEFTSRRPREWSLPQWLAFCAAGWHASVTWYRTRIYNILHAMVRVMRSVRIQNLQAVNSYLSGSDMCRVELLLRATQPTKRPILDGTRLRELTDEYQQKISSEFESGLQKLDYKLNFYSLTALVKTRRVEHIIYPLLYVLLKRQFDVMRLARIHILNASEFRGMSQSIATIFKFVDARVQKLREIFDARSLDIEERMSQFAFGMVCIQSYFVCASTY
ncbi:hypothetical protein C8J57DRAFT_1081402, partial [Mycena rebaudengoi]